MTDDREFMELAIREARASQHEDGRVHPKVGAVAVKDGRLLASAHRGEGAAGDHAEYVLLEKKLSGEILAGATIYTTLEPCTTRSHPKVPCVERLIERKVARVVIGMLDPNSAIRGKGQLRLREANIATDLFPADLMAEIEELNREFARSQRQTQDGREEPEGRPAEKSEAPRQVSAAVYIQGPGAIRISGTDAVRIEPGGIKIVGPVFHPEPQQPSGAPVAAPQRQPMPLQEAATLKERFLGSDQGIKVHVLKELESRSYEVQVERCPEMISLLWQALKHSQAPPVTAEALRVMAMLLGVRNPSASEDLVQTARTMGRAKFTLDDPLEVRNPIVEQAALNLLSAVLLSFGASEPEDLDRLVKHVVESPGELYDRNRPFTLLLALKKDGRRVELNDRLVEQLADNTEPYVKDRINELLDRLRLRD